MKTFVVSLQRSKDRREYVAAHLSALQISFEFSDAVDGSTLTEAELCVAQLPKWQKRYYGYYLSPSELGCSLSHLQVYKKMVDENIACALILEDDVWLTPSVVPVLMALENKLEKDEKAVWLLSEGAETDWYRFKKIVSPYGYAPIKKAYFTHAYVITLAAAKILLTVLYPVAHVADCWNWLKRHRVVNVYSIKPILSTQNNFLCKSVISESRFTALKQIIEQKSVWQIIKHKTYRVFWVSCDHFIALMNRFHAN